MKRNIFILCALVLPLLLWSCGDEIGGSGQCGGVITSGLCVAVDSITPVYDGTDTKNVDIIRLATGDCNADGTADDPEPYTDHDATVAITVTLLDGYADTAAAGDFITITHYTIDYSLSGGYTYTNTPPTISPKTYYETVKILKDESGSFTARLIDLNTKDSELGPGWPNTDTPSYTATYTFYGTDDKANPIQITGYATFTIDDFDNC